jgi:hypothetical protein
MENWHAAASAFYNCLDRLTNPHMKGQPTDVKRREPAARPQRSARAGGSGNPRSSAPRSPAASAGGEHATPQGNR